MARLRFWWYRLTDPKGSGRTREFGVMHGHFRVRYADGTSSRMCYDVARDYAAMFDGTVELA